jgi:hypothetical protein
MTSDGTMDISLCDSSSYDTSLVLYAGSDCGSLTQVACNGDASSETDCQSFYSGIYGYPVSTGDTYYIRIGGWQGATGPGTLTLTCVGANAEGACCLADESCLDGQTAGDCDALGGSWYVDQACADVTCPTNVACTTGNGADPTAIDGAWTAGTSDAGAGYSRAALVSAPSVADATVYGLSLVYNAGWTACTTPDTMPVNIDLLDSAYASVSSASASYASTNLVYAGIYALHGWTASNAYTGSFDYLQAQSQSGGAGECWLLWMSADGGTSYIDDGTGWAPEAFGVNYCIVE